MWARATFFAAAALAGVALTQAANAQAWPPVGTKIKVNGCVARSPDNLCLIVKGANGSVYTINEASPAPTVGRRVHLTGTVASHITFCWSGPFLDNIKWNYLLGRRCPK